MDPGEGDKRLITAYFHSLHLLQHFSQVNRFCAPQPQR